MPAPPIPRILRTLWYLRREQWAGQLRYRFTNVRRPVRAGGEPPRLRFVKPAIAWLPGPPHASFDGRTIGLIERRLPAEPAIDWDVTREGPLFAFHLHQFDWARSEGAPPQARLAALRDWVARHREGTGWHPAPTSLRLLSWIKLLTTPGALPEGADARRELLASLADHVATVAARRETHLLANHYLWNLLALVFAGIALEGGPADRALAFRGALLAELEEQILPDGAHVERSPMYHALLLETVLDLANAARSAPGRAGEALGRALADVAARMLGALAVWTHPDGEIALLGDSAFGIAHPPARLRAYAEALGIAPRGPARPGILPDAGFARLEAGPLVLIATAAPPMPSYQPGHAHCDALSFELSAGCERVVTDTGVTEYVPGPRRHAARTTAAHATIEVEGQEQAEIWAAHRVGGRPDVALTRAEPGRFAETVCAGWATSEVLHRRRFEVEEAEAGTGGESAEQAADAERTASGQGGAPALAVHDRLDRPARRARLFLPLAPGLAPVLTGGEARIPLTEGRTLVVTLPQTARFEARSAPYFPGFGRAEERTVLVGEAQDLEAADWRFALR